MGIGAGYAGIGEGTAREMSMMQTYAKHGRWGSPRHRFGGMDRAWAGQEGGGRRLQVVLGPEGMLGRPALRST